MKVVGRRGRRGGGVIRVREKEVTTIPGRYGERAYVVPRTYTPRESERATLHFISHLSPLYLLLQVSLSFACFARKINF